MNREAMAAVSLALLIMAVLQEARAGVPREAHQYRRELTGAARQVWGMEAPVAVFAAQIHQESLWRAEARSHAGAAGLAQFMPATAGWISAAYPRELGANAPLNPGWALRALVRYDRHLWLRILIYDSSCERAAFMLSAYNGGDRWRLKRQAMSERPGVCLGATCDLNPGIRPAAQRENARYSRQILIVLQPLYRAWGGSLCV